MTTIYLIGSLRNPAVPQLANALRAMNFDVFDDWHSAGETADDSWRDYEKARERSYVEALRDSYAAQHVFDFDLHHLNRAHAAILMMPAGKSGHLELGWMLGQRKKGYVLLDNPDRWDVMYKFADGVFATQEELLEQLRKDWMR